MGLCYILSLSLTLFPLTLWFEVKRKDTGKLDMTYKESIKKTPHLSPLYLYYLTKIAPLVIMDTLDKEHVDISRRYQIMSGQVGCLLVTLVSLHAPST